MVWPLWHTSVQFLQIPAGKLSANERQTPGCTIEAALLAGEVVHLVAGFERGAEALLGRLCNELHVSLHFQCSARVHALQDYSTALIQHLLFACDSLVMMIAENSQSYPCRSPFSRRRYLTGPTAQVA